MSLDALFKQANAAQRAGDWANAERRYLGLARVKPAWAWHNLGVVYQGQARIEEAEAAFRAALLSDPESPATRHSLGMLAMAAGRFAEGWPLMEARREVAGLKIPRPKADCPEWQGEDLAGKHLVVVRDQGYGDQIQMARFIPALIAQGARVTFVCDRPLERLFSGLGCELQRADGELVLPAADHWTYVMSVPYRLGLTLETIPGATYLSAQPRRRGGVGVVTQGKRTHFNDRHRSLGGADAARLRRLGMSLAPEDTGAADFQDTADIVAGLDLVITVDTSVAHLAGALGRPVWILLSAADPDWRWLRERSDSPWYPSATLYRQTAPDDWGPVLDRVEADLAALQLERA